MLECGQNLVLRVSDNGHGIDEEVIRAGRAGHFGILGMQERAAQIGGKLSIRNLQDGGVEVVLQVPGKIMFANIPEGKMSRLSKWVRSIRPGR
jgi:signal transduction histidine kinase